VAHALRGVESARPDASSPLLEVGAPGVLAGVARGRARSMAALASAKALVIAGLAIGTFALPLVFTTSLTDVFALSKTVAMLALAGLLAVGLPFVARDRAPNPSSRFGLEEALLVYLALMVASTVRSPDPLHSLVGERLQYQGLLTTLGYATAFLAARWTMTTEPRIRGLMAASAAASLIVVGYGLLQQADLDPIWDVLNNGRIFSTLGQATNLAAYLALALPVVAALALAAGGWWRLALLALAAAITVALGLTFGRGGYLGAAAGLLAFAALVGRRPRVTRRCAAVVLGSLAAFAAIVAVVPPAADFAGRVADRARQMNASESSAAIHVELWLVGSRMALENPLLGVGPEVFPVAFPRYRDKVLAPERAAVLARHRPESPHNVPIAIAAGAGIPALAAYLALVLGVLIMGWRRVRAASPPLRILLAGLLAAAVGHIVTDLFMTAEVSTSWLFWVVLGVLSASPPSTATQAE
jgi:O-antigen ligase